SIFTKGLVIIDTFSFLFMYHFPTDFVLRTYLLISLTTSDYSSASRTELILNSVRLADELC
ncbi:hypothetical protein, partial [Nostoc sp.]|uniref:hypothetical protein n=1 Tax=Nostoc sp. TaxID=1180 RepID=UPI002FF68EF8